MAIFKTNWPKQIKDAVQHCRPHFANVAVFSGLISLLYLAPTLYMMQVYDRVVPTGGTITLFWLTIIIAIAIGTLTILDNIRSRLMTRAALQLDQHLSADLLDRILALPQRGTKDATHAQALRDFDGVRQVLSGPPALAMFDLPWTPVFLIASFMVHPLLGMMTIGGGVVLITLAVLNERAIRERSKASHKANSAAYAAQADLSDKAEVIRAMGMRRAVVAAQCDARAEGLGESVRTHLATSHYGAMVKFVRMTLQSLSLGAGAFLAIEGQISAGMIIAASVLLSRALQPIEQLVGGWQQISSARNSFRSLVSLFESTESEGKTKMILPDPAGNIEAINLTLRNPQESAFIIRGINLKLEPGKIVGLIGHSGAGKSTLARILAGGIQSEIGEIRIDGASYADWDQESLARHIGYVPQDCALLTGTIAENISRFAIRVGESADTVAVRTVRAAQMAGVHELILRLPNGYETILGTQEFALSGGQAQRIALARALYGDPKLLVLDEPSSALDADGEAALLRAMQAAKLAGAAVLVVAHRSFVLHLADTLVVMSGGTIESVGPREEVLGAMRAAAQRQNVVAMARG